PVVALPAAEAPRVLGTETSRVPSAVPRLRFAPKRYPCCPWHTSPVVRVSWLSSSRAPPKKNVQGDLLPGPEMVHRRCQYPQREYTTLRISSGVCVSGVMCGIKQHPRLHTCLCQLTSCNYQTRFNPS